MMNCRFAVSSDRTKNITLNVGYKVSGSITSTTNAPVKDGIVLLSNYLSGWFSKDTGYYFVCAPAGTYKFWASPRNGYNHFSVYSESNFVLDRDIVKNITVVLTNTVTPSPTPIPTPTPLPDQAWISMSVDVKDPVVGSVINVTGRLSDYEGRALPCMPVTLSYADATSILSWVQIGSAVTTKTGEYDVQWVIAAHGNFLLKVEWIANDVPRAFNTTSVGFLPYSVQSSLAVESNSIVSESTNADAESWIWAAVATIIATPLIGFIALRKMGKRKNQSA